MPVLSNARREAFAQARFSGLSVMDAYRAAGYEGDTPKSASAISQHPEVKARLLELHNAAATVMAYDRMDAIRDLVTIIKASPSEATPDHPLCEVRTGRGGPYHRFPSKLRALSRLIKILGWDSPQATPPRPDESEGDPDTENPIHQLIRRVRTRTQNQNQDRRPHTAHPETPEDQQENATSTDASAPLTPRQEAFAQARCRGLSTIDAYQAAGYIGDAQRHAFRVGQHAAVRARIAALRQELEAACPYKRHEAINDLIFIVQASPDEASDEHPLCERHLGSDGPYARFPCKLATLLVLIRLMGWVETGKAITKSGPSSGRVASWPEFNTLIRTRTLSALTA